MVPKKPAKKGEYVEVLTRDGREVECCRVG
jgi:hypothetical protein